MEKNKNQDTVESPLKTQIPNPQNLNVNAFQNTEVEADVNDLCRDHSKDKRSLTERILRKIYPFSIFYRKIDALTWYTRHLAAFAYNCSKVIHNYEDEFKNIDVEMQGIATVLLKIVKEHTSDTSTTVSVKKNVKVEKPN